MTTRSAASSPGVAHHRSHGPAESTHNWVLWGGILLLATAITLEGTLVATFQSYALSSFGANGYLGSISSITNFV